jgi:hypothetical protein
LVDSKEISAKNGILKQLDFIWKLLHWTGRERMGVLLVLTFGEGAGVEKVKSLKEIETQFCG